jgi:hypothetical protein
VAILRTLGRILTAPFRRSDAGVVLGSDPPPPVRRAAPAPLGSDAMDLARRNVEKVRSAVFSGRMQFLPFWDSLTEETPEIRRQYPLMLREPVLKAALGTKVLAVASLPAQVHAADIDDARSRAAADAFKHALERIGRGSRVGFTGTRKVAWNLLAPLVVNGWSFSECAWEEQPERLGKYAGKLFYRDFKSKDTRYLWPLVDEYKNVVGYRAGAFNAGHTFEGDELRDFVCAAHFSFHENPLGMSDFRSPYRFYWLKITALELWGLNLEKWAKGPFLKGTYGHSDRKALLEQSLSDAQGNSWVTVPQGDLVEVMDTAMRGTADFQAFVDYCDKQMLIATMGSYLQILEGQTPDGRGDTQVQKEQGELFTWALAALAGDVVTAQMAPAWTEVNYAGVLPPTVTWGSVSEEEMSARARVDEALQKLGMKLSEKEAYAFYGRQRPVDDADVLKPDKGGGEPSPGGGPGGGGGAPGPGGPASPFDVAALSEQSRGQPGNAGQFGPGGGGERAASGAGDRRARRTAKESAQLGRKAAENAAFDSSIHGEGTHVLERPAAAAYHHPARLRVEDAVRRFFTDRGKGVAASFWTKSSDTVFTYGDGRNTLWLGPADKEGNVVVEKGDAPRRAVIAPGDDEAVIAAKLLAVLKPKRAGGGGGSASPFDGAADAGAAFSEDHWREAGVLCYAESSAAHKVGDVWKGPSGRWFTRRQDGRIVPAKNPNAEAKKAAPAKKAAASEGEPKPTLDGLHAEVEAARKGGLTPEKVGELGKRIAAHLTCDQIAELKKRLGEGFAGKGGVGTGPKQALADRIAARAAELAGAAKPAEKSAEEPKAGGARKAPAEPPAAQKPLSTAQRAKLVNKVGQDIDVSLGDPARRKKVLQTLAAMPPDLAKDSLRRSYGRSVPWMLDWGSMKTTGDAVADLEQQYAWHDFDNSALPAGQAAEDYVAHHVPALAPFKGRMHLAADLGDWSSPAAKMTKQQLFLAARLPGGALRRLAAHKDFGGMYLGEQVVSRNNNLGGLATQTGAAYGKPDETYDQFAAGVYCPDERIAVSTAKGVAGAATHAHEMTHALGDLLGHDHDPELREAHVRLFAKLDPHARTGGPGDMRGVRELLARGGEHLADFGEASMRRLYDDAFVDYLLKKVFY